MNKKKILFAGASGYGNLGDDAYKDLFIEHLKDEFELFFDSPYPDTSYIKNMDAVVIGGGGLIYDNETPHFEYMTSYLLEAERRNKPYYFISCGVQLKNLKKEMRGELLILEGVRQLQRWKPFIEKAKLITVRSETCKNILLRLAPTANVEYFPDLVYSIKPVDYHLTIPKTPVFVLTPSSVKHGNFKALWEKFSSPDAYIISMARNDEAITDLYAKQISSNGSFRERYNLSPREACRILSDASEVIVGRYHGRVMALAGGIPKERIHVIDGRYKSLVEDWEQDQTESINHIKYFKTDFFGV